LGAGADVSAAAADAAGQAAEQVVRGRRAVCGVGGLLSYDNALAESTIGLYKAELIRQQGHWRGIDDLEIATF